MCEVEAFGIIQQVQHHQFLRSQNLMKMKGCSTSQSSTAWGGDSRRAIDGNTSGNYKDKSCTHTENEEGKPAWWKAQFYDSVHVGAIQIFNREDCCADRLKDFKIYIGDNEDYTQNEACQGGKKFTGAGIYKCDLTGKYLAIEKPDGGILTLCEVQAYGVLREITEEVTPVVQKNLFRQQGVKTSQSSTGWGGASKRAIDGNTSGIYKEKSCTHTEYECGKPAWW